MLGGLLPEKTKRRKVKVPDGLRLLVQEEAAKLIDMDKVTREALQRVEQSGIVFLDEIDKIAGREAHGPDVSREGVQRDLLPIVEGSTISTKYGQVKTDHILFIAAGAFHVSNPRIQPIAISLTLMSMGFGWTMFHKVLIHPDLYLCKFRRR